MFFQNATTANNYYFDGEYLFDDDAEELAGIGSFFKKIAKIALPVAAIGINAIPGIGQLASAGISAGIAAGQGALDQFGSGGAGGGGVVKGLAPITAYGQQVNAALQSLKSQVSQNPDAALAQAEQLAASLGDSARVYQPKKGKDAEALAAAKSAAQQNLSEIRALASQAAENIRQQQQAQSSGATVLPNGQIVYPTGGGGDGSDMTKILMFGFVGLGALMLLKG